MTPQPSENKRTIVLTKVRCKSKEAQRKALQERWDLVLYAMATMPELRTEEDNETQP